MNTVLFDGLLVYVHALYIFPILIERKKITRYAIFAIVFLLIFVSLKFIIDQKILPARGRETTDEEQLMMFSFGLFIGVIALIVSAMLKFTYDYFRMQAQQQQILNHQLQTELKYLKLQINPHFLFNTLNNLLYLTQQKSFKAPEVVEKLGNIMRYMLEKSNDEKATLSAEIEFLKAYVALEKIRIPNIEVLFTIEGNVENKIIPPLILLPFVENVFKHGIDKSSKENMLKIKLHADAEVLNFSVKNVIPSVKAGTNGIGLENLNKRLELLYPSQFEIKTTVSDQHYEASLTIPYLR